MGRAPDAYADWAVARASASDAPHAHVSGRLALWYTRSHRGQMRASGSYAMMRPLEAQCLPTTCGGSSVRTSPALASGSGTPAPSGTVTVEPMRSLCRNLQRRAQAK